MNKTKQIDLSYQNLVQMGKKQQLIYDQLLAQHAQKEKDLQVRIAHFELQLKQFQESINREVRREIDQCYDFALKSLPWWNRGKKAVEKRALELLKDIRMNTVQAIEEQPEIEGLPEMTPTEAGVVHTATEDENGNVIIAATGLADDTQPDRETAELEHQ